MTDLNRHWFIVPIFYEDTAHYLLHKPGGTFVRVVSYYDSDKGNNVDEVASLILSGVLNALPDALIEWDPIKVDLKPLLAKIKRKYKDEEELDQIDVIECVLAEESPEVFKLCQKALE